MELKVIKKFNGAVEGKTLCPGDVIQSNDVERINALVGRGFCVIVALDSPSLSDAPNADTSNEGVDFQGTRYDVDTIKAALGVIGVKVAHNAKEKAVCNVLAALSDEQAEALSVALNNGDSPTTDND